MARIDKPRGHAGAPQLPAGALWLAVLVLGIILQTGFVFREYLLPWGWRVRQVLDEPRLLRSADLSVGAPGRRTIEFVNSWVPQEAAILLPPTGEAERFAVKRSMQYFFFPRELIECGTPDSAACGAALADPDIYILATADFPHERAASSEFIPAPGGTDWFVGIYGPRFVEQRQAPGLIPELVSSLPRDLGLVLLLAGIGVLLVVAILNRVQALDLVALALPVGAGVGSWLMFLLSWLGVPLTLTSTVAAQVLLLLGLAGLVWRRRDFLHLQWPSWSQIPPLQRRVAALFALSGLVFLGVILAFSVGASYRLFDPVQIWSVKGYGIAQFGTVQAAEEWGVHGLAYPLGIPLQAGMFYLLDGDALPGSKLLYPFYGLSLCLTAFTFLRRQQVELALSSAGSLLLATVPIVVFHATSGFANLPYTACLVAGCIWLLDGLEDEQPRTQLLAGLLLGLAAWTRPEGILFVGGVVVVLFLLVYLRRWGKMKLTAALAPILVISGSWFIFSLTGSTMQGSNLEEAVTVYSGNLIQGNLDLGGLVTIFRVFAYSMFIPDRAMFPAISATAWGAFFPIVILLLVVNARFFTGKENRKPQMLAAATILIGIGTVGVFYIRSFSKPGYESFIERAFPRAFLPTAMLLGILALWAVGDKIRRANPN